MTAKIQPRIDLVNRTKLEEVIPLKTPFVLHVEPANVCNLACRFCPVGDRDLIKESGIRQGMLKLDIFKKVIDDLVEFESKIKAIHLYGNGEPLLNQHFPEMVKYAKQSEKVEFVDTTTNGLLLKPEKADALINSGIDKINISVNGLTAKHYAKTTRKAMDFAEFKRNLKYLFENRDKCKICIKSISELYDRDDKRKFFDIFSPIADYIFLENLTDPWPHYDIEEKMGVRSNGSAFSKSFEEKQVCCLIFYTIVVNFDATVSLCCVDWHNDLIIGDAKSNSIKDIWNSERLLRHQMRHLRGERSRNAVCRECKQLSQCVIDNIDPYMDILRDRLQAERNGHDDAKTGHVFEKYSSLTEY